jgi:rhodanese-related sulfurtransferase
MKPPSALRRHSLGLLLLIPWAAITLATEKPVAETRLDLRSSTPPSALWVSHEVFPTAEVGRAFIHVFHWTNGTSRPIRILSVKPSCDCVQVTEFPHAIGPNSSGRIVANISPHEPGAIDWLLFAEVDGSSSLRLFGLSGRVEPLGGPNPPTVPLLLPRQLFHSTNELAGSFLVDVRNQAAFGSAHIPGSLNLPLYAIKTMTFLRPKRLILLNEGHSTRLLLEEAGRLRQHRFASVAVLETGLQGWRAAGGALEGDDPQVSGWTSITSQQFYNAMAEPGWVVIGLSPNAGDEPRGPLPVTRALPAEFLTLRSQLTKLSAEQPNAKRLLVVTPAGESYCEFAAALGPFQALPIFCLTGGSRAYDDFFAIRLASEYQGPLAVFSQEPAANRYRSLARRSAAKGGCCGGR